MIKVGVLGAKGRMGSEVVKAVNAATDMQLHISGCANCFYNLRAHATLGAKYTDFNHFNNSSNFFASASFE